MRNRRLIFIIIVLLLSIAIIIASLSLLSMTIPKANNWALDATQIAKLQTLGFSGKGVTIAIIDTGVDATHQEFDPSSFSVWYDLIDHETDYTDSGDHGTHIAGLLVSQESTQGLLSGIHLQGIAPQTTLFVIKAIPSDHFSYTEANDTILAQAVNYCIDYDADIILLSLGKNPHYVSGTMYHQTAQACQQAIENGIFVVAPAGNDGQHDDGDVAFPAVIDEVIAVGSIGRSITISAFSSQGHQYPSTFNPHKKPELVAPGEGILSTRSGSAYGEVSGTSQAATYVAGILALLLEAYPEYRHDGTKNEDEATVSLFKTALVETAKKIGSLETSDDLLSHDDLYGYGLVQAYEAYTYLAHET